MISKDIPTEKQRTTFLKRLNTEIKKLETQLSTSQERMIRLEALVNSRESKRNKLWQELVSDARIYSDQYGANWLISHQTTFDELNLQQNSEIRELINNELKKTKALGIDIAKSISQNNDFLVELESKPQKRFNRLSQNNLETEFRLQAKQLAENSFQLTSRVEHLEQLKLDLREIDLLSSRKERREISLIQKSMAQVAYEREKVSELTSGPRFEVACTEFVVAERERRRERVLRKEETAVAEKKSKELDQARRRRQQEAKIKSKKAKALSLQKSVSRHKTFLSKNSEVSIKREIDVCAKRLQKIAVQYEKSIDTCKRKVEQLRVGNKRDTIFKHVGDREITEVLLEELSQKNFSHVPSLDNLLARHQQIKSDYNTAANALSVAKSLAKSFEEAQKAVLEFNKISHLLTDSKGKKTSPPRIPVENWEDAEELALRYIRWLGFPDAKRTKAGADEGKDVESSRCVAQVKDMGTGATRAMVQHLFGIAAAEKKKPIFFSRTYAKTAMDWGERHNVALFKFDRRGVVIPANETAERLLIK